ncbi:MAG: bifunctional tRNA (5-methylaminomethyl-2-thiouridine)(34)-methyltransferase MnmD/FAD-dependent 5-carboxymethylaminomethyl-2-thiouridine(34) oxidoreductase MnmC [Pseudomonadota bacterium]
MSGAPNGARGHVPSATIEWNDQGQPVARDFDDVYFSRENGLAESRYVFLQQNRLEERWAALPPGGQFVLGETGFGSGLNFLAAWQCWRACAPSDATLRFLSVEAFPMQPSDLARALEPWTELSSLAASLTNAYPRCLAPGLHQLDFDNGLVQLTLALGEALEGLQAFLPSLHPLHRLPPRGVDAWMLDGFSPARNPAMWRSALFEAIRDLSAPGATFATFTAAGEVRRGLEAVGFDVRKAPGFGRKRDMLNGVLGEPAAPPPTGQFSASPYPDGQPHAWHVQPSVPTSTGHSSGPDTDVAIIGGGLAGCHLAARLARSGLSVKLLEAEPALAQGGSGNAQGVLYAKPSARGGLASHFNLAALLFAQRHYAPFWAANPRLGAATGVLHVATSERDVAAQSALVEFLGHAPLCRMLDHEAAEATAGVPLPRGGLWFPDSGWLAPPDLCEALVASPAIHVQQARVARLARIDAGRWAVLDAQGQVVTEAPVVVLACANALPRFEQTATLPVQAVRGQVSFLPASEAGAAAGLRTALCADGYVTPPGNATGRDVLCFGASFSPGDPGTDTRVEDHAGNLERLRRCFPDLVPDDCSVDSFTGRASLRCATPDRLPMAGPAPDIPLMSERFSLLRKNAKSAIPDAGAWHDGLYVSAGYGSRGLAYIPLATESLAAQITGAPPVMDAALRIGVNPARFLIRDLKRNRA